MDFKELSDIFEKNSKLWEKQSKKQPNIIAKNAMQTLSIALKKISEDIIK